MICMNETNNIIERNIVLSGCINDFIKDNFDIICIFSLPGVINTITEAVFLMKNDVGNDLSEVKNEKNIKKKQS